MRIKYTILTLSLAAFLSLTFLLHSPRLRSLLPSNLRWTVNVISDYNYPWIEPNVPWERATPESRGIDGTKLKLLKDRLMAKDTDALLVVREGKLIFEHYALVWNQNKPHGLAAMPKAIVASVLLMTAIDDGRVGVEDLVSEYIPSWKADPRKRKVTLRQLASHTSGIENVEFREDVQPAWKNLYFRDKHQRFPLATLGAPIIFEPGTRYEYSGTGFYVLSYALAKAYKRTIGADLLELFKTRITEPLEIPDEAWRLSYGESYRMDGMNLYAIGSGAKFTARAVARLGQLMLNDGTWGGRRIVSSDAVQLVTSYSGRTGNVGTDDVELVSGLGWYLNTFGFWPSVPRDAFVADSVGHHRVLVVIPSLNLVVVRLGAKLGHYSGRKQYWDILGQELIEPLMAAINP